MHDDLFTLSLRIYVYFFDAETSDKAELENAALLSSIKNALTDDICLRKYSVPVDLTSRKKLSLTNELDQRLH